MKIQAQVVLIQNFTRKEHLQAAIYIIKQDIRIYVPYSWPNGWTDWAEILWGHSKFFYFYFFFHGQRRALQLV